MGCCLRSQDVDQSYSKRNWKLYPKSKLLVENTPDQMLCLPSSSDLLDWQKNQLYYIGFLLKSGSSQEISTLPKLVGSLRIVQWLLVAWINHFCEAWQPKSSQTFSSASQPKLLHSWVSDRCHPLPARSVTRSGTRDLANWYHAFKLKIRWKT